MNKQILGLDLGTNSIGWALVRANDEGKLCEIAGADSRIIPMTSDILGSFERGNSVSQTQERTQKRGMRRLRERFLLRRERLLRVLAHMNFLPEHFASVIDRYGKFTTDEPKIAWTRDDDDKPLFIFHQSFMEMVEDFKRHQPDLLADGHLISHDWTLYYLRKKALTEMISKEELSWVLLSFLQKRGYSPVSALDEEEPEENKQPRTREYFHKGRIVSVTDSGQTFKKSKIFIVELEDGMKGKLFRADKTEWEGLLKDIIVTENLKDGKVKTDESLGINDIKFKIPTEAEWDEKWELVKRRTENDITQSRKTIGEYIYDSLLANPSHKVIGKLVRVVNREFYYDELHRILKTQSQFHQELTNSDLYAECISLLYPTNDAYRQSIASRTFEYLIADDIILYQRPLKTKKSLISNCQYESTRGVDGKIYGVKCIAKSHPLFEEFRLWQWISSFRLLQREAYVDDKLVFDIDITQEVLTSHEDYAAFYDFLSAKEEISMNACIEYLKQTKKKDTISKYRWNYVEDKAYPCMPITSKIASYMEKGGICKDKIMRSEIENIWHILYSVNKKSELKAAMRSYCEKHYEDADADIFAEKMSHFPSFSKEYGSYSAKAIKRLIPLMRMGKYWSVSNMDSLTQERIEKIINGEYDENIKTRVHEKAHQLNSIADFQGLPLWLACYIVYNRHSEMQETARWESPTDITNYVNAFKYQSLHNPIVEQVVLETLKVVRDIWEHYGKIDEIHVELGRELKKTNKEKERISRQNIANEQANTRAKAMLMEFMNPEFEIEEVRPYSPSQQELFRIYEDGVLNSDIERPDYVDDVLKKYAQSDRSKWPTRSEVLRYKLWLEQNYRSPYTGNVIPLGRLFTAAYQIEHVIPQARYFDDSYSNKVICEAEVNQLKGSQLGYEFIKNHHGEVVGKGVEIFSVAAYEEFVKKHYASNQQKMKKLLMDEIPESFTARQMNDSRYISRLIVALLSNIVRKKDEDAVMSTNVIAVNGSVTTVLKKDWGMNDVWNKIILPRFVRMEEKCDPENKYTAISKEGHRIPQMPIHMKLEKKRIDHRHHAMDAIVIACCTRNHVNLISNEAAKSDRRIDLQHLLRENTKVVIDGRTRNQFGKFFKPWDTFTQDAMEVLCQAIVSFKQSNRILNLTTNYYQHFAETDGKKRKTLVRQEKGDRLSIRRSLHGETVYGHVNLKRTKEVPLAVALSRPQDIVNKEIRDAINNLLAEGKKAKDIKAFFAKDKDVWADFNEKKIAIYYFTDEEAKKCYAVRKEVHPTNA